MTKTKYENVTTLDESQNYDPLLKIKALIDLAALVPPAAKLPEISLFDLSEVYEEWNDAVDFDVHAFPESNKIWNNIYEGIKTYPKLIEFLETKIKEEIQRINLKTTKPLYANEVFKIINRKPEPFDMTSMLLNETYYDFYHTRNKLKFVAYGLHLKRGFYLDDYDYVNSRPIFYPTFSIRENGIFLIPDSKIECLFGIDLERLRVCQLCEKIFWADRIDSQCCSSAHNLVLRQRRFRKTLKVKARNNKMKMENWLDREKRQERLNQKFNN